MNKSLSRLPELNTIKGELYFSGVNLNDIARQFGTPCYVYSERAITNQYQIYASSLNPNRLKVHYAVKANSNLNVLACLVAMGSGFDIVSEGELRRVLAAGGSGQDCIFSGVGKSFQEIRFALEHKIRCFNVESLPELERINQVAVELDCKAPISLRINPNVDPKTHPYISTGLKDNKFGIAQEDALAAYRLASTLPGIKICGIDCHIGSQIIDVSPYYEAFDVILALICQLKQDGIHIDHVDIGGGLGITYHDEIAPDPTTLLLKLSDKAAQAGMDHLNFFIEPGRSMVGNAGLLLCQIEYLKHTPVKNFCIVDAAMNDLARPSMYEAFHQIVSTRLHDVQTSQIYDVVGPVCESGDWLGRDRALQVKSGDFLAILSAGAYGFAMSSNYNTRCRAAEVWVDNDGNLHLIRARETYEDLWQNEFIINKFSTNKQ